MLPDFDDDGNLPLGIHRPTIEEVAARFGRGSPEREVEMHELADFVAWARHAAVERLLVNGSARTLSDPAFGRFGDAVYPFLQILIAADNDDFEQWAAGDFATDRQGRPKGVVEVIL